MFPPLETSENYRFFDYQVVWRTTFDPKWVNSFITSQEINLHPSKDWSNSKLFYTSDKVCSKSKNMVFSLTREMFISG